jgi:AhpD family alkylhydroperoxidase
MAHIEPRPASGSGLFVRLVYFIARLRLGRVPVPIGIMAYQRVLLLAVALFETLFERGKALTPRLKALATLKAATVVGCRFCIDIGSALGRSKGVLREEDLKALLFHHEGGHFDPLELDVLDYAVLMTETPMVMPRALFDRLQRALGVEGLVELSSTIAWENFRARFNHAFDAKEEGYSEGTLCLLPPGDLERGPARLDPVEPH